MTSELTTPWEYWDSTFEEWDTDDWMEIECEGEGNGGGNTDDEEVLIYHSTNVLTSDDS